MPTKTCGLCEHYSYGNHACSFTEHVPRWAFGRSDEYDPPYMHILPHDDMADGCDCFEPRKEREP